jgi:hypothetical protein
MFHEISNSIVATLFSLFINEKKCVTKFKGCHANKGNTMSNREFDGINPLKVGIRVTQC